MMAVRLLRSGPATLPTAPPGTTPKPTAPPPTTAPPQPAVFPPFKRETCPIGPGGKPECI